MPITIDDLKRDVIENQRTGFILISGANGLLYMVFHPENRKHKQQMLGAARRLVVMHKATETWFCCEAWAATAIAQPNKTSEEIRDTLPDNLKDAPGRREILVCQHEGGVGGPSMWIFDIVRNEAGKICDLIEDGKFGQTIEMNVWLMRKPVAAAVH